MIFSAFLFVIAALVLLAAVVVSGLEPNEHYAGFVIVWPGTFGWTEGYVHGEKIFWLGPLGIMFGP